MDRINKNNVTYHHHQTQYIPFIEKNYGQGVGRKK